MLISEIVHRLRVRANNAEATKEVYLAEDIRFAIAALETMDREATFRGLSAAARAPGTVVGAATQGCHQYP
jgi:hypothetical protein